MSLFTSLLQVRTMKTVESFLRFDVMRMEQFRHSGALDGVISWQRRKLEEQAEHKLLVSESSWYFQFLGELRSA
jgi:hypothetical protein